MSTVSNPWPRVLDPQLPSEGDPPRSVMASIGIESADVAVILSRGHASLLALALHEFDRAGALIPAAVRVLRDSLDRTLTSRAAPALCGAELLAARRKRREWLWRQLLEEQEISNAYTAIRSDLKPDRAAALRSLDAAMAEYSRAGYVNQQVIDGLREGWQC